MYLNMPSKFEVNYPKENKRYGNSKNREQILKMLWDASKGYCMYCGRKLDMDDVPYFDLEHSVEKRGQLHQNRRESILMHCKYNLSLSCTKCNQKYKTRMIEKIELDESAFNIENCLHMQCTNPCETYLKIKKEHCHNNNIILQPQGIQDNGIQFQIVFNLIKQIYEPLNYGQNKEYDDYIWNHISRFHLNREMRTDSIIKICEFVISMYDNLNSDFTLEQFRSIMEEYIYENIMALEFVSFIISNFYKAHEIYEFCKLIIILSFL